MQSPDIKKVEEFLKAKRFYFASDIHIQPNSDVVLVSLPESMVGKKVSAKTTSRKKLTNLKAQFAEELGLSVEFILIRGAVHSQIEAGINALLSSQFPGLIQEAFLSFREDGLYDVWLEPVKIECDSHETLKHIKPALVKYLSVFKSRLGLVRLTTFESALPSSAVILRSIKKHAPTTAAQLFEALQSEEFSVPSQSWLDRKLDGLRKKQLLLRHEDGQFALTELGLNAVPHSNSRSSSDVERALALGRRKW